MTDYPAAIDYPAHPTNTLGPPSTPKGWVLHTPEEPADDYPGTPYYFAQPNKEASTHYFVSYLGFVFQCVPESVAPIANGVVGKPYPFWANDNQSLNRQSLSVEIEGYAATIANTISPAQKTALLNLLAHRCKARGIPKDRAHIIGHYEVANNRSDPGTLNIDALVAELQQEDDMFEAADRETLIRIEQAAKRVQAVYVRQVGKNHVYRMTEEQTLIHVPGPEAFGLTTDDIVELPVNSPVFKLAVTYPAGVPTL